MIKYRKDEHYQLSKNEKLGDAPAVNPSSPFGKFQESRKPFKGSEEWMRRYHCDVCDEDMMSDEALQLHRIWEQLKLLNQELSKIGASERIGGGEPT